MTSAHPLSTLWACTGTAAAPLIVDVRTDEDFAADPRLLPGSIRRPWREVAGWAPDLAGREVVVVCDRGLKISLGCAAWARRTGSHARNLSGGFRAWRDAGLPLIPAANLPPRDEADRTRWAVPEDPGLGDAITFWLIRRWLDPQAVLLPVPRDQIDDVADRFGAAPHRDFADRAADTGLTDTLAPLAVALESPAYATLWQGLAALAVDEDDLIARALALGDGLWQAVRAPLAEAA